MTSKIVRGPGGAKAIYVHLMRGMHHVATLLARTDDRWSLCDPQDQPLVKRSFRSPRDARDYFDQAYP